MKKLLSATIAAWLLTLPFPVLALCVGCSCLVSTTDVAFGTYNPLSATPLDHVGNVHVSCTTTLGLAITVTTDLGAGQNSASFSPRKMASGANRLNYDLYADAAHTGIWGDGTSGTQHMVESLTLSLLGAVTRDYPVYGRIPGSQTTVRPGSYGDSVVVTITYQ